MRAIRYLHRKPVFSRVKASSLGMIALLTLFIAGIITPQSDNYAYADPSWPTSPPAAICEDTGLLSGPSTAPAGAVTVPAGDNSSFNFNQPGETFWFESGTHWLANDSNGQIVATDDSTYIGAPGAVLDGRNINLFAFTGEAENVTIKYLTIINFGTGNDNFNVGVVNHDSGTGWTVSYNTISDNDGAGVFMGNDNVVSYNCLKDNGQYGFSMFIYPVEGDSAIKNVVLDHNEIAGNNTDDWEAQVYGCGCTGGGKFWDVNGATVTNNYVHDNKGTGLWADTNNIDFLFEGNYIDHNDGEGIWYEISYNATIRNNWIGRNAWVSGNHNLGSPGPAIYLSEAGGDSRLATTVSGAAAIRIYDNTFVDNFSGVSIYENTNRFCNSNGNTSAGYCTPFVAPTHLPDEPEVTRNYVYPNPIVDTHPCYTDIDDEPYTTDCRWHAQNIEVNDNEFHFDDTVVPCAGTYCGAQALTATGSNNIPWMPYTVDGIQNDVMFNNNNSFHDNQYFGNWHFAKGYGETISFNDWRAAPFNQDADSTFTGDPDDDGPGGGGPGDPGTPVTDELDADTIDLEGSIGQWQNWYAEDISQSDEEAHGGTHSLRVDITDSGGWGVQTDNWKGYSMTAGVKKISLSGKLGSGGTLQPKLVVKWMDDSENLLQTNEVILPALSTTEWQTAYAVVDAPEETATAILSLHGLGSPGDYLYLDDIFVGDAPNLLDADTAGGESSTGQWQADYSAAITASTLEARRGTGSLRVDVTAPSGWGLNTDSSPGFEASAGDKRVSLWAKQGAGSISAVTLRLKWFDSSDALLQTDLVPLSGLTTNWQQAVENLVAPEDTATVYVELYSSSGSSGDSLYLDDIVLTDQDANNINPGDPDPGSGGSPGGDLDADTAGLEGSIGQWQNGSSEDISRSTEEAHGGTHSLRVDITDTGGWEVQTANVSGFAATAGVKKISLWGKLGSGSTLQPKLTVEWLDNSSAVLQTDDVTLPALTTAWQTASAVVDAPEGATTALVTLNGSGSSGDYFYLDDMFVGDAPNLLDANTAGGESSVGKWEGSYSATVTASTLEAHRGSGSLQVDVTDPWGWGLDVTNWPGFEASAGNKRVSFWAKQGAGSISAVTLRLKWFDSSEALLQTDLVPLSGLTTNWQQTTANLVAPSGTATVFVELYSSSGSPGDSLYLDEIVLTDLDN